MSDHITRLGARKNLCNFCDRHQVYEVTYDLKARCAHAPIGACIRHLHKGVRYVASCPDAGNYVLVGRLP
jgi:hypothetical protein